MRIRPYDPGRDFDILNTWITDPRTHAMWSADRMPFPLDREGFDKALIGFKEEYGDIPFAAVNEDDRIIGFFCLSYRKESNEAMLAFVVIDDQLRGKGIGRQMLTLAAEYAFDHMDTGAVQLNVFDVNQPAMNCYLSAGFKERSLTEKAFTFGDEQWGRCNMVLKRGEK